MGKIFINARILWDPFLIGLPLIRVSRGAQDISLYIHAWGSSKAMSDSSKVYLSLSASFHQLLILSMHSSRLIQGALVSLDVEPSAPWCRCLQLYKQDRRVH